jgi:AAA+ superfamily predicted ATPase
MPPEQNSPVPGTPSSAHYKFRSLKVHASDEWLADGTKKYRQVYDRYETTYIRVELSFFNKLFDEADWEVEVTLKCYFLVQGGRQELCSLTQQRKVSKEENIVYIRDSWGNAEPGVYWMRGNYMWEAYLDNVLAGEAKFFVEDQGPAAPGENRFFEIQHIRLFEGDASALNAPTKKYLTKFSAKDTRYIWGECCLKNNSNSDYYAELFFNYCDDAGHLKGRSTRLIYVPANTAGQLYNVYPSWGNDEPGAWKEDLYTLEVVFMDNLIATVPFQVGNQAVEGQAVVLTGGNQIAHSLAGLEVTSGKDREQILQESLAELNTLIGLHSVKQEVNEMVKLVQFYQETGKDILNRFSLHSVFTGNPGTGKTTVARILSKIYKGLGILEKGHLVEVDRQALVAGYIGQTAIKTAEKIEEAMGGILFIDEAYSLANERTSQNDFGAEAIQVILKRMEDFRGKFGVIVAGYTDNMQEFIHSNPGLRSRFDKYYQFDDYSPEDMFTIALSFFGKEDVQPDAEAASHLKNYFAFLYARRDKHFGNARTVRQVAAEAVKNQHLRLAAMKKEERTPEMLRTLVLDDVREFEIKNQDTGRRRLGFSVGDE